MVDAVDDIILLADGVESYLADLRAVFRDIMPLYGLPSGAITFTAIGASETPTGRCGEVMFSYRVDRWWRAAVEGGVVLSGDYLSDAHQTDDRTYPFLHLMWQHVDAGLAREGIQLPPSESRYYGAEVETIIGAYVNARHAMRVQAQPDIVEVLIVAYTRLRRESARLSDFGALGAVLTAADEQAITLLLSFLDPAQTATYNAGKYFDCKGNVTGNTYRISWGNQINIKVLTGSKRNKKACVITAEMLPVADQMLAQLFLITTDEQSFLDTANYWD